jgi:hypothetical protein
MARATGTKAAATRRRSKHEQRIGEQHDPWRALAQTWAWVYAEIKRHPRHLNDLQIKVHALGAALNDLEANPGKEPDR